MLKIDDLSNQLTSTLSTILKYAIYSLLMSDVQKSILSKTQSEDFANTFDEIFSEQFAKSFSSALYFFLVSAGIQGTVITVGNKHTQFANISALPDIAGAGTFPNSFKIVKTDVDSLESQLESALEYYLFEALFTALINDSDQKSVVSTNDSSKFAATFSQLCGRPLAQCLSSAIDYYVRQTQFYGTIQTTGNRVTQKALITSASSPAVAGTIINTIGIKTAPVDDLKSKLEDALYVCILSALGTSLYNDFSVEGVESTSTENQTRSIEMAEFFVDIFAKPFAETLSEIINMFINTASIMGTIITVGTKVTQTANVVVAPTPSSSGITPNTLGIF